jgi:hypothetical protein
LYCWNNRTIRNIIIIFSNTSQYNQYKYWKPDSFVGSFQKIFLFTIDKCQKYFKSTLLWKNERGSGYSRTWSLIDDRKLHEGMTDFIRKFQRSKQEHQYECM